MNLQVALARGQQMHPQSTEHRLQGTALSPGLAIGRPCFLNQKTIADAAIAGNEQQRLTDALLWMARRLQILARTANNRLGGDEAEIFSAWRMMLDDESFRQQLFADITSAGMSAEQALRNRFRQFRTGLESADSDYLQQRCADITELEHGILNHLHGTGSCRCCKDMVECDIGHCRLGNDHILVGSTLAASLPIELDSHTVGCLVENGSRTSHAVILARALQLPVVGNIHHLPKTIPLDSLMVINGDSGEIILNPGRQTLQALRRIHVKRRPSISVHAPLPGFKVMANLDCAADVNQALAVKADGIGLYRSEIEILAERRMPSAAEQQTCYRGLLAAMGDLPVTIRLLDLGADKHADWIVKNCPADSRGRRGASLLLACPELLREQARALAVVARQRPVHVLYPMVTDREQFIALRSLFESCVADLKPALLRHGVMFEVPSACLQARQILDVADFGSIGTNDLIQFLFATGRGSHNGAGGQGYEHHAVLWQLIEQLSGAARLTGKPLSICGELAGNPECTQHIMAAGISTVSTGAINIAGVRKAASVSAS